MTNKEMTQEELWDNLKKDHSRRKPTLEQYSEDLTTRNGHVSKNWAIANNRGLYTGSDKRPIMIGKQQ